MKKYIFIISCLFCSDSILSMQKDFIFQYEKTAYEEESAQRAAAFSCKTNGLMTEVSFMGEKIFHLNSMTLKNIVEDDYISDWIAYLLDDEYTLSGQSAFRKEDNTFRVSLQVPGEGFFAFYFYANAVDKIGENKIELKEKYAADREVWKLLLPRCYESSTASTGSSASSSIKSEIIKPVARMIFEEEEN